MKMLWGHESELMKPYIITNIARAGLILDYIANDEARGCI
jgi:hypothetical protein